MPRFYTSIDGFTVSLDDGKSGSEPGCWISKGRHCSSLNLANDSGVLESDVDEDLPIQRVTLEKIDSWAASKGY